MTLMPVFRYRVDFHKISIDDPSSGEPQPVCSGSFSEITGFEASMEPHKIAEGGRNWGDVRRAGKTTFATLVLKRGMTEDRGLWRWFEGVANGGYAYRLNARVVVLAPSQAANEAVGVLRWEFANCLPVKIKAADLSATSTEIGIEELHLDHEGLRVLEASEP
ncbi:MAG: phage tail protein [Alphaproteobacteria bacterium]|nr:phage tail protein [Alphaproteobacteria bacterium]